MKVKQLFMVAGFLLIISLPKGTNAGLDFGFAADFKGTTRFDDYAQAFSLAVDGSGNVYTIGHFQGTVDFDPGPDTYNLTCASVYYWDLFVSKLDTNGNFVWAKVTVPNVFSLIFDIAVDGDGNVYTTGSYLNGDMFVSKLDTDGNFVWAKVMGGAPRSIAVDGDGNVYTTGSFQGTVDFDPGPGIFELTAVYSDIFVSKLDPNGQFIWAKAMGGTDSSIVGESIAVDGSGNVYTTGGFAGTINFDPGSGTHNLTSVSVGVYDIFVSKLDPDGDFAWAAAMGGLGNGEGSGIAVDGDGNVYTTGYFHTTVDFDPGPDTFNLLSVGLMDIFVSKLDTDGKFVWARAMGGGGGDGGVDIAVDGSGNVYTTGAFYMSSDFDPGPGTYTLPYTCPCSGSSTFVSKLDTNGNFVSAASMGDSGYGGGWGIALDGSANVYTAGLIYGTGDFDPGDGVHELGTPELASAFVSKLVQIGEPANVPPVAVCVDVTVDANESCLANAVIDGGSYDPDGGAITRSQDPTGPYGLGDTLVTLTVLDDQGASGTCEATVTLTDSTAPAIECNSPATIIPPDAPISFTATASDSCSVPIVEITEYDCFMFTKNGKRIDNTESCVVQIQNNIITILDSGGVGDHITWQGTAVDDSGNSMSVPCEIEVVNPAK